MNTRQQEEELLQKPTRTLGATPRMYLVVVDTGPFPVLVPTSVPGPITFRRTDDGTKIIPSDDGSLVPASFYALGNQTIMVR